MMKETRKIIILSALYAVLLFATISLITYAPASVIRIAKMQNLNLNELKVAAEILQLTLTGFGAFMAGVSIFPVVWKWLLKEDKKAK